MNEGTSPSVEPADAGEQLALWNRLAGESVAMLGTRDADGLLIARPVMPVKVEPEGRVWLFTALDGDIARDIAHDQQVHLSFVNQVAELYASLNGVAQVLHDPQTARAIWSPTAGVWYPNGPDDPSLGLVRIDVHRGDYWDMKDARLLRFFRLGMAALAGTRPDDVATHRRFTP
jgi:general stress protein 26